MISHREIEAIAAKWIEEFSVDPYVLRARRMDAWLGLDDLVHHRPEDALLVLEELSKREMINWTFEGIAAGPFRTFLMLYDHRYDDELDAIGRRNESFRELHALAMEGI